VTRVTAGTTLPVYQEQLAPVPGFAETVCKIGYMTYSVKLWFHVKIKFFKEV